MQGELKEFKAKALVSQDKSIRMVVDIIGNDKIDLNYYYGLLHKPVEVEIKEINQ